MGSVPHIYTKGAIASYLRASWPLRGARLGRPAVVPPAGRVWGGAPLPGRWGREGGGPGVGPGGRLPSRWAGGT
jgi:hypothetical protein